MFLILLKNFLPDCELKNCLTNSYIEWQQAGYLKYSSLQHYYAGKIEGILFTMWQLEIIGYEQYITLQAWIK